GAAADVSLAAGDDEVDGRSAERHRPGRALAAREREVDADLVAARDDLAGDVHRARSLRGLRRVGEDLRRRLRGLAGRRASAAPAAAAGEENGGEQRADPDRAHRRDPATELLVALALDALGEEPGERALDLLERELLLLEHLPEADPDLLLAERLGEADERFVGGQLEMLGRERRHGVREVGHRVPAVAAGDELLVLGDEAAKAGAVLRLRRRVEIVEDVAHRLDVRPRLEQMPLEAAPELGRVRAVRELREDLVGEPELDPQHLAQLRDEQLSRRCQLLLGHRAARSRGSNSYTRPTGVPRGTAEITPVEPDPGHAGEGRSDSGQRTSLGDRARARAAAGAQLLRLAAALGKPLGLAPRDRDRRAARARAVAAGRAPRDPRRRGCREPPARGRRGDRRGRPRAGDGGPAGAARPARLLAADG